MDYILMDKFGKEICVEEYGVYKGYDYIIIMQPGCFRTGYVCLPSTHRYNGLNYEQIPIICHGGLTFSQRDLPSIYSCICNLDPFSWWIGFDTCHAGDGRDYEKGKELYKDCPNVLKEIFFLERLFPSKGTIADLEYCINECKSIIDQALSIYKD